MIPAGAEYLAYEAEVIGAKPMVRASFLPFLWKTGADATGTFVECSFVSPDRIKADYHGFVDGYWLGPPMTANLQVSSSPAVLTWGWNYPGFDVLLYWRGADSTGDLALASWTGVSQGGTIQIAPYYQFKAEFDGYRAWAEALVGDANAFTAWAEDTPNEDSYQGYAADTNVPYDQYCYIDDMELLGEFTVQRDIEQAGSLSLEVPNAFDDLVAGSHQGLLLNNRHGSFSTSIGGAKYGQAKYGQAKYGALTTSVTWTPAPLYSQNKSSFLFANESDWYGKLLKIQFGWDKGSSTYTEFLTLFLGKITKWGPFKREVDQDGRFSPNTVEIYARDFIFDCLQTKIALPADDGTPQPLTYGEFLCKADEVVGWSPAPVLKSAYFELPNYNELDHVVASGGGAISLVTPGLTGARSFQAQTTGANQAAYGMMVLPTEGELFITGTMRIDTVPGTLATLNMNFIEVIDKAAYTDFSISIDNNGFLYWALGELSKFNILAYVGVAMNFALWFCPTTTGHARFWLNGEEVLKYDGDLAGDTSVSFRFGAITGAAAENWTIQFDDIEISNKYYLDAYKVEGGPFANIAGVYIDNMLQPDSQTIGSFTQTLTRFPEYGMMQFASTDPNFSISGDVMARVVMDAGGMHAVDVIADIISMTPAASYVDSTSFAAAKAACPNDIINARFDSGKNAKRGLRDYSLGMSAADAIKEICSRCLYLCYVDHGEIKLTPYTGVAPSSPDLALTASELWQADPIVDMDNINTYVAVKYGWNSRNPDLFYLAGSATTGSQGTQLSCTWDDPVCIEDLATAKDKADLLLIWLSAQERIDPVKLNLAGIRLELMDQVSVYDVMSMDTAITYSVLRKEISLDTPKSVSLLVNRVLGE